MEVVCEGGLGAVLVVSVLQVPVDDGAAPAALLVAVVEEDAVVPVVLPLRASVVVEVTLTTAAG